MRSSASRYVQRSRFGGGSRDKNSRPLSSFKSPDARNAIVEHVMPERVGTPHAPSTPSATSYLCINQNFTAPRATSSRRPPRHRRGVCSMAYWLIPHGLVHAGERTRSQLGVDQFPEQRDDARDRQRFQVDREAEGLGVVVHSRFVVPHHDA